MRSAEVALAAGVTIRALRHYHRIGLLAEPRRELNGYRVYEASHVSRLLRIRLLSSAGVSLARMAKLLDDAEVWDDELACVEADLTTRIRQLEEQREVARSLRAHERRTGAALASPVPAVDGLGLDDVPPAWQAFDEDLVTMLHLAAAPGEERRELTDLFALVASPERAPGIREVLWRFRRLGDAATDRDIDEVVEAASKAAAAFGTRRPRRLSGLRLAAVRTMIEAGPFTRPQRTALVRMLRAAPAVSPAGR